MVSVRTSEYLSKTSAYKLNPSNEKRITSRSTGRRRHTGAAAR